MPPLRTHESVVADADKCVETGEKVNGVTGRSPFIRLNELYKYKKNGRWVMGFDIIRDTLVDPMHICSGIGCRHLLKLLKGLRTKQNVEGKEVDVDDDEEVNGLADQLNRWKRSKKQLELADELFAQMNLGELASKTTLPFQHTGDINSYQSLTMFRVWGLYILRNLELDKGAFDTVIALFSVMKRLTYHTITQQHVDQLLDDTLALMKKIEIHMPATERDIIVHLLIHVPSQLKDYGPCRSFWCFGTERFFNFAKNQMVQRKAPPAHLYRIVLRASAFVGEWETKEIVPEEMNHKYSIDSQVTIVQERKHRKIEVDVAAIYELLFNTTPESSFHGLYKLYKKYKDNKKKNHHRIIKYEEWLKTIDQSTLTEEQQDYLVPFPTTAGKYLIAP